ncbi:hypothetical protein FOYG_14208 [Fusarium oxysporum NRRL 32931]|uniref:Uncharacterized protein n=1 Tax=Fusarium oxysporum NRRL 32931 TaxID=660029 RepID=W9HIK5_FUSOX|nr:hypothetical protein FOYG_14208 [Fusarium oxysporum NRRL 32931]
MNLFTAPLLIIGGVLSGVAQAESNSTASNTTMVGWVAPAPRRSTWSIIWSCLSIFILCSWKCVHLNIPTHEEIQGEWHTMQLCRGFPDTSFWPKAPLRRKWRRKIIWMTLIALAPEFGVTMAAKQYVVDTGGNYEGLTPFSVQKYTMAHAFYVQMGGIIVYETSAESSIIGEDSARNLRSSDEVSNVAHTDSQVLQLSQESGSNGHGAPRMARSLIEVQPDMFRIPESEIKDLSKADVITKAFAITQCTWLIVQSISRVAHGYSISLLELATLAFIFCAFIMHIFWWNKPFDVESRRVVTAIGLNPKVPPNLSTFSMDDLTVSKNFLFREGVKDLSWQRFEDLIAEISEIIDPADTSRPYIDYLPSASLYIASATFLAIHLAAWNWDFPSSVVKSLWRWLNLSTLVTSFAPLILGFLYSLGPRRGTFEKLYARTVIMILLIAGVIYIISRFAVLGLTFYCLSSMPENAYATLDWFAWVPHFS